MVRSLWRHRESDGNDLTAARYTCSITNTNGPKVLGIDALVKSGYMLGSLSISRYSEEE